MADDKESVVAKVRTIRRATRKKYSPEEKMRIVLEGLRGETKIRELCRREGIATRLRRLVHLEQGISGGWERAPGGRH